MIVVSFYVTITYEKQGGIVMGDVELNISEIIDEMSREIANLIKQVYVKNAEIRALREKLTQCECETEVVE